MYIYNYGINKSYCKTIKKIILWQSIYAQYVIGCTTLKLAILMVASLPELLSKISPMIGYAPFAA